MGLERFGRGEGGNVKVLALLEKTLIDVFVAWLSRTSGPRYWLACVRADEEGCSPLAGKLSVHSQTCLKDDRFVSITGNSFFRGSTHVNALQRPVHLHPDVRSYQMRICSILVS